MTVVGLCEVLTVINSAKFKSFLLIMCIDAPEYTTNSLSSCSILDGERRQHLSEGVKKVDLCFSFNFKIFLVSFYAASGTHRSCLPETDPQILERSGCADEVLLGKIILNDGFWTLLFPWRNTALVSRTHRIGFDMVELFRKINEDLVDSMTWNTRSNCRVSFNVIPLHFCCHSF